MQRLARPLGSCLVLLLVFTLAVPALGQETESPEAKKEVKAQAREERIQEYLRKKEERRLRREAEAKLKQEEAEAKRTAEAMAQPTPAADVGEVEEAAGEDSGAKTERKIKKDKKSKNKPRVQRSAELPRRLANAHAALRSSEFGQDPTVASYMDLISAGEASAQQIAAFGNFLGQAGRLQTALAYYDHALDLDSQDSTIWLNAGTLQRQSGNYGAAAAAYGEALSLDPNHAYAHYNLGAVLDEMGQYDAAIEEYKVALTLDPTLGDPSINPQAANNEKLTAVRLILYKEQAGTLGLPLVTVPEGEVDGGK